MDISQLSYWQKLDLMQSQHQEQRVKPRKTPVANNTKAELTPMTIVEMQIVDKLQNGVTFPPATGPKRFIGGLNINSQLSSRGRAYLAFIAYRFRRQWTPTQEEFEWIVRWKNY